MPPSRAMRIAVAASVTVSIAELTSGIRSGILAVSRVATSTSLGTTSLNAGARSTSSNVNASRRVSGSIAILLSRAGGAGLGADHTARV